MATKKELGIKYPDANFVEPLKLGEISRNSFLILVIGNVLGIILLIIEICVPPILPWRNT